MRTESRVLFISRDKTEFRTAALCRAHERKTAGASLVGLSAARVLAAQSGEDPDLADAFVDFVNEMRNAGRRRPNGAATENNGGDNARPALSDDPGAARAYDSPTGTEKEHIVA
jgi:hypothetical protein